jgi:DNA-binding LacI/PurR family transcriptional regulator
MKSKPTLKDVAKLAGVSRMAVSAVVNDTPSTVRVSDGTRKRILEAVEELQYNPDVFARSLRLQRANIVGFYNGHGYVDMNDPFVPSMLMGIQLAIVSHGSSLLLYNGLHQQDKNAVRTKLLSSKADGVLIWPAPGDADLLHTLGETAKPFVQVVEGYPGIPSVVTDDYNAARVLAEHLVERGHRHVLYRRGMIPLTSEEARYRAFKDVFLERNVKMTVTQPAGYEWLTEDEKQIIRSYSENGITAVACWHDASAVQVARFLASLDIRIPEDVALTGFDGFTWHNYGGNAPLTTVNVDWKKIAGVAANLLIRRINGEEIPDTTVVPGELRIGGTT